MLYRLYRVQTQHNIGTTAYLLLLLDYVLFNFFLGVKLKYFMGLSVLKILHKQIYR